MFVPPKPEYIEPALGNWETYLKMDEKDPIVQLAILKAQFELIHPFLDGNGRIGRMLVPLILYHKKLLSKPLFYISAYFEGHRLQYYSKLNAISNDNDWDGWISFFLQATLEQAEDNCGKATEILRHYSVMKQSIDESLKSHQIRVLDFLFSYPTFTSTKFIKELRIPKQSAERIIKRLENKEIIVLRKKGTGQTPNSYRFERLLQISELGSSNK